MLTAPEHEALMRLIEAYADARHEHGAPEYNAHTMEARNALYTALLHALTQTGGWVSVDERLPDLPTDAEDDGVKVWTWDGSFVTEDEFMPAYEQPAGPAVGGWLRTGEWFAGDTLQRVTHWMLRKSPLPPSPAAGAPA
ncbi:DUF551 domain-containing protein [Xenophilus sp. Marseille-Q4582]|uniref:DUF551 domain-containing protein n=1 Tax=Xenophilus sp. Marseille-Q4582 TaxID=2866600 RepID=UPI001CE3D000|nr:DUF551 domain-containing protein [Xenophilus sp. Marseille-Q4582]